MLSASEIRNAKFGKSMSGYKQEDVDVLLDKIEADYVQYERIIKDFQARNEELTREIEELKKSQGSIQNVLVSAQRLADQIVNEAKEKSEEIVKNAEASISVITAKERELSTTFERKAQERKSALEKELSDMVREAQLKADSIKSACEDSVARQQQLFDKVKMEIAAFKAGVTAKYKEHLELLGTIPDSVPMNPREMAQAVAVSVEKAPAPERFIQKEEPAQRIEETAVEDISSNTSSGFVVEAPELEEADTEE